MKQTKFQNISHKLTFKYPNHNPENTLLAPRINRRAANSGKIGINQ